MNESIMSVASSVIGIMEDKMVWEFVAVFAISYVYHALGITIGYHRLLSHRSYSCPKWFEYFWVFAGFLAFEGSPIWWSTIHRAHHRHVDTPLDPHSPRFGLMNAHLGWMTHDTYPAHIDPATQSKDLLDDPIYKFLEQGGDWKKAHQLSFGLGFLFRFGIFLAFGWVPALASLLAGFAVLQIPLMLNVFCHMPVLGYKNYPSSDDSVNVWWVGLLAMGEGWHNNHHAGPGSARTGMRPWEFDLSWHIISFCHRIGIITRMNVCTEEQLLRNAGAEMRKALARQDVPSIAPGVVSAATTAANARSRRKRGNTAETAVLTKTAN